MSHLRLIYAVCCALLLLAPSSAFAQSSGGASPGDDEFRLDADRIEGGGDLGRGGKNGKPVQPDRTDGPGRTSGAAPDPNAPRENRAGCAADGSVDGVIDNIATCIGNRGGGGGGAAPAPPTTEEINLHLSETVKLPAGTPVLGPDPSINEWNMAVVGYPYWLWTEDPEAFDHGISLAGITVDSHAEVTQVVFDVGDPEVAPIRCTITTPWRKGVPAGTPSPNCGFRYLNPGHHELTATTTWLITWSSNAGQSGSFEIEVTASQTIRVGELESVIIG